jgi:hypothetical protein
MNEVVDFLNWDGVGGPVETLLLCITSNLALYGNIEKDHVGTDTPSVAHNNLPTFGEVSGWVFEIARVINFIVRLGEKQDAINTLQEALVLQCEPGGCIMPK